MGKNKVTRSVLKQACTASFLAQCANRIPRRVGEESSEFVLAEVTETHDKAVAESADWHHRVTPMAQAGDLPPTRCFARMR
jgi:phosphoribosyl-ATP pyrophosphohydrolase